MRKLEAFSNTRDEELSQLKTSIENLKEKDKTRCRFGWKCSRGFTCRFDHVFLFKKVNNSYRNTCKTVGKLETSDFLCELCCKTLSLGTDLRMLK